MRRLLRRGAFDVKMRDHACEPRSLRRLAVACGGLLLGLLLFVPPAQARGRQFIYTPNTPAAYDVELEPHLIFGSYPPGAGVGSGYGIGVRGSLVLLPQGVLTRTRIHDTLALGIGLDYGHYRRAWAFRGYRDQCLHFQPGPAGTSVCTEVTSHGPATSDYLFIPVVLQWNFWLSRRWSLLVEPGLDLYYLEHHGFSAGPAVYLGGRFLITDRIALVLRAGYPTFSLGASFMW
jgi:hypothetical protein